MLPAPCNQSENDQRNVSTQTNQKPASQKGGSPGERDQAKRDSNLPFRRLEERVHRGGGLNGRGWNYFFFNDDDFCRKTCRPKIGLEVFSVFIGLADDGL